jgi:outer membrane protein assembly factor BamB
VRTDRQTLQSDPAHTGHVTGVEGPVTSVDVDWHLGFDHPVYAQPVIAAGWIVVGATGPDADTGQLAAVEFDGSERWRRSTPMSVLSPPAVRDGTVYLSGPRTVEARALSDGSTEWTVDLPTSAFATAVVVDDSLLVGTRTGSLTARSATSGDERWATSLGDPVSVTPAVRDGLAVAGTDSGAVVGVDLATGAERWRRELGDAVRCAPTIAAGSVFVATTAARLHALDPTDGTERWATDRTLPTASSPAVADETCYWSGGSTVVALNAEDGSQVWETETGGYSGLGHVSPPPVATRDTLYVSTGGETVYAFDRSDGSERWTFSPPSGSDVLSLVVGEGRLYVGTSDGTLLALGGRTNYRPTPSFTYVPRDPEPGEEVTFDATESSDPDGSIEAYRWDLDGDGEFEATGPTVTRALAAGEHTVRLEVEDDEGARASTGGQERVAVRAAATDGEVENDGGATVLDTVPGGTLGVAGGIGSLVGVLGIYRLLSGRQSGTDERPDDERPDDERPDDEPPGTAPQSGDAGTSGVHPAGRADASFDDVTLGDALGSGPLTEVSSATFTNGGPPVAVETLGGVADRTVREGLFERFTDGVDVWSRIDDHPNVVSVLASGTEPFPWAALERCPSPLEPTALADRSFDERRSILVDVLEGVHHGHRHGLYHGALTPTNVMLPPGESTGGDGPVAVVADWETSAVHLDPSLDVADAYPRVVAPEQTDPQRFGDPGPLTDVYQLGVLAYALFTGSYPFEGVPADDTAREYDDVTAPHERVSGVPTDVNDVLSRALALEPGDRHETVLHLRDELERI